MLGIWICGCSLFYRRELSSGPPNLQVSMVLKACKRWCPKDLRLHAPAAPVLMHSLSMATFLESCCLVSSREGNWNKSWFTSHQLNWKLASAHTAVLAWIFLPGWIFILLYNYRWQHMFLVWKSKPIYSPIIHTCLSFILQAGNNSFCLPGIFLAINEFTDFPMTSLKAERSTTSLEKFLHLKILIVIDAQLD